MGFARLCKYIQNILFNSSSKNDTNYRIMETKEMIDSMMGGIPIVPFPGEDLRCALDGKHYFIHEAARQGESTCKIMENTFKGFLQDSRRGELRRIYIMMHIPERRSLTDEELDRLSSFIFDLSRKASTINVTWGLHANAAVSEMEIYIVASNAEVKCHEIGARRNGKRTESNRQWVKLGATVIGAVIAIWLSVHLMDYDPGWISSNSGLLGISWGLLKQIPHTSNLFSMMLWCLGWYLLLFGFINSLEIFGNLK